MAGLLLCICHYKYVFIVSKREGFLDFATNIKLRESPGIRPFL